MAIKQQDDAAPVMNNKRYAIKMCGTGMDKMNTRCRFTVCTIDVVPVIFHFAFHLFPQNYYYNNLKSSSKGFSRTNPLPGQPFLNLKFFLQRVANLLMVGNPLRKLPPDQ